MKTILVIGEKCLDEFVYGDATRLNPESPTPVFIPIKNKTNSGMAGNVYDNLNSISCNEYKIIAWHQKEPIVKKRFVDITSNYILLRVDEEIGISRISLNRYHIKQIREADAVIISDYNKGYLSKSDLQVIFKESKLSFMDTKKSLGKWALDCDYIKINEKEYHNPEHSDMVPSGAMDDKLIVTLGENGCRHNGKTYLGRKVAVRDVVGAGDTFLAAFAYRLLDKKDVGDALVFANLCSASVVAQKGVAYPNLEI